MKVARKVINAVLPSIYHFRKWYKAKGATGWQTPEQRTLGEVRFIVSEDGYIREEDYAVEDARNILMDGDVCVEATEIVNDWMLGYKTRRDVVIEVQELFANYERELEFLEEAKKWIMKKYYIYSETRANKKEAENVKEFLRGVF